MVCAEQTVQGPFYPICMMILLLFFLISTENNDKKSEIMEECSNGMMRLKAAEKAIVL